MNRRQFTRNTLMASAAVISASPVSAVMNSKAVQPSLKKGIMWGSIGVGNTIMEKFRLAKDAGFDGVEVMSHMDRKEVLDARAATGLEIPSVCGEMHWKYLLSDPDPGVRAKGVEALKLAMEDASVYGADTVLLVPGRVSEDVSYDECWTRSTEELKKVIPVAKKLKIKIAIENVWNNFLLSPMETVTYIDQFKSPFVAAYFDCGNILHYGWPEQWIKILNHRLAKVHIKEFSRKLADTQGKWAGFGVKLMEGDVNWSKINDALDKIGYHGWTTIEQPGGDTAEGLKDLCERLTKINAS